MRAANERGGHWRHRKFNAVVDFKTVVALGQAAFAVLLNRKGHDWTVERLRRAVHRMVREKLADPELLARSPRRPVDDHHMKLVAAIAIADPSLSLRDIAGQLDQLGERPVRGGRKWQPSSVKSLIDEAFRFGLLRD